MTEWPETTEFRDRIIGILGDSFDCSHETIAEEIMDAIRSPTPRMTKAGEAWRDHCGDADSMFEEMMQAARYPQDYPT